MLRINLAIMMALVKHILPVLLLCASSTWLWAAEQKPAPATAPPEKSEVERFCSNISTGAMEARLILQQQESAAIEKAIAEKTAKLDAKIQELKELMALRDDFMRRSEEATVAIFAKMRPDAAAAQLISMDERSAASVVAKLTPRAASLILAEMEPARAARLAETIAMSGTAASGSVQR